MNQRTWPSNSDYVEAIQHPASCFADGALRAGSTETGPVLGLPKCATGQNAIVFPMRCTDRTWAIRCFTTPAAEGRRRYEAFSEYLSGLYCPAFVVAEWLDAGIRTDNGWWPIVKMEWIEGRPLHEVVKELLGHPNQLRALAEQWRETVRMVRHVKAAHGDLQHGNVLMDTSGALRLVDYDGLWLPTLAELANGEVGHPNYQHPERLATGYWDEYVDTFAALVIYTSLRALAADPSLWDFNQGENLIFRADDYIDPGVSEIWIRIARNADSEVVRLGDLLASACRTTVRISTDLDEILDTGRIPNARAYRSEKARTNWWDPDYDAAVAEAEGRRIHVTSDWAETRNVIEPRFESEDVEEPIDVEVETDGPDWRIVVIVVLLLIALAAATVIVAVSLQH